MKHGIEYGNGRVKICQEITFAFSRVTFSLTGSRQNRWFLLFILRDLRLVQTVILNDFQVASQHCK